MKPDEENGPLLEHGKGCWVCWDDDEQESPIVKMPCRCKGTLGNIHENCLKTLRRHQNICTTCKSFIVPLCWWCGKEWTEDNPPKEIIMWCGCTRYMHLECGTENDSYYHPGRNLFPCEVCANRDLCKFVYIEFAVMFTVGALVASTVTLCVCLAAQLRVSLIAPIAVPTGTLVVAILFFFLPRDIIYKRLEVDNTMNLTMFVFVGLTIGALLIFSLI